METVRERPAYRAALASRRCLLPANGYFEWAIGSDGAKQPHFLHPRDGAMLPLAGLYERWRAPTGEARWTCTILTTAAAGPLAALHNRTPMMVPPAGWYDWLDPRRTDPGAALTLLIPAIESLDAYPVHPRIGNVREIGAQLI